MGNLYEVVGDRLRIELHPGQTRAWECERRIVAVVAGHQSGKTSFEMPWLWREIQRCGPGDYGFIGPTYKLLEVKAIPEFKQFFEKTMRLGTYSASPVQRFAFSSEGAERMFGHVPEMPTNVYFGYADNPDSLESATYKAAVLDEAGQKRFRIDSWEAVRRRLSIHRGRILIGTTPYFAAGWLRTEIYNRWKGGDAEIDVVNFASTMNPAFPREEYERARDTLPRWKFNLFYRGVFDKPAGMVYDCFDEDRHVIPRVPIPSNWRRYVGLDFGGANTAAVFFAEDPVSRRLIAYREYKAGNRTAREHVEALKKDEPVFAKIAGGSGSEGQWRHEFQQAGMYVEGPATGSVAIGIERVYALLKTGHVWVFSDLRGLIDELGTYSYELDAAGEATEKIEAKETYHRLDAVRYILGHLKQVQGAGSPAAVGGRLRTGARG